MPYSDSVNGSNIVDAGSSTATAYNLGNKAGATTISGGVGGTDTYDYYRFIPQNSGTATFSLTGLSADLDLYLLNSSGASLDYSNSDSSSSEYISYWLTAGQAYYIYVQPYRAAESNYSLSLTLPAAIPSDAAGNTLALARNIGNLTTSTQSFSDYVGTTDTDDYYKFILDGTSNLRINLSGLSADADLKVFNAGGGLIAGGSSTGSGSANETINLDNLASGTYYARVYQGTTGSNTNYTLGLSAQVVAASKPDLSIYGTSGYVNASNTTVTAGGTTALSYYVVNWGANASPPSTTGVYLSSDTTITTADTLLTTSSLTGLTAYGGSKWYQYGDVTVALPSNLAAGTYYLGAIADYNNAVSEANELNNASYSVAIRVNAPAKSDLSIYSEAGYVSASNTTVTAGGTTALSYYVVNWGANASPSSTTGVYLSSDTTITTADTLLTTSSLTGLTAYGGSKWYQYGDVTVTLPSSLASGTYYLGAIADYNNAVSEANELNNASYSVAIRVSASVQTLATAMVISNFDRLSIANTASSQGTAASTLSTDTGGGFWKLFFALSSAAYVHKSALPQLGTVTSASSMDNKMLGYLTTAGLRPLTNAELQTNGFSDTASIHFADGFFVATSSTLGSSVATVFRSQDQLFLTFRGTDGSGDVYDDALNMQGHYDRFSSLFTAIDKYAKANGLTKINVSGHSLGGEMAAMYMNRHPDANGITYRAVTLEAANKVKENYSTNLMNQLGDSRFVNFEMSGDVVPDLGIATGASGTTGNYGKTIYMNDDANKLFTSHTLGSVAKTFDAVATALPANSDGITDRLLYIDGPNTDGVIFTDGMSPLLSGNGGSVSGAFNNLINTTGYYETLLLADGIINVTGSAINGPLFPIFVKNLITSGTSTSIGGAVLKMAQEDNNELAAMGTNFQLVWPHSNTTLDQGTLVIHPTNAGTYNVPANGVGAVNIANDNFSPSEDLNINASATRAGIALIGNDGDNSLRGGSGSDLIIGGGNSTLGKGDLLIGGGGNDMLYGGNYKNNPFPTMTLANAFSITAAGVSAIQNTAAGDWYDDVTFLYGGSGNDQMIGAGDNDYFFIDVTLNSNASNVDTVKSFYVSGINPAVEDYLCFSASQLDSGTGYLSSSWMTSMGWSRTNVTVFGTQKIAYAVDVEAISENFFKVNGIGNYISETFFDNEPAFILDYSNGNLYFDADGDRDVGDQILVARLIGVIGDQLKDMHANQILVFPDFSFLG